ncbi:MAG: hypothetical protein LBV01_02395 [Deltaproteobacteria bacterium]|jgi:trehalose synthase|nr:hypothetical protein [Deltaproteobacteria bacterium]
MSVKKNPAASLARLLVCFLLLLPGCGASPQEDSLSGPGGPADQATVVATGARRADPGYIQYLERLSMLGSQTELARIVSGSQLAWLRAAGAPFPDPLLSLADTWLHINPFTMLPEAKRSVFASLSSPLYWQIFSKSRIGGLYLSPAGGSGALWAYNRKASVSGEDAIQYAFSETAGTDADYFKLLSTANTNNKLLGIELIPAATGLGPDFFLAARYHRQYSGIYCMVELPQKVWAELPGVSDQWQGAALTEEQTARLAAASLLPSAMDQDLLPVGKRGGWAVTGEIHGVDGLSRRWAYRYYGAPDRPVLNWEDPSAGARRILSGSAIRNVGMLGGALVGLRLHGLYGLDAVSSSPGAARFNASPADEAALAVSREVRRYGGWSWLQDEIPLSLVARLMPDGPDFFQDTVFSPGIEHALLTGSTEILEAMLDDALALDLDMRRFVHATSAEKGVSYALPHLMEVAEGNDSASVMGVERAKKLYKNAFAHAQQVIYGASLRSPKGEDVPPLKDKHLNAPGVGIPALNLGRGNIASIPREEERLIGKGHFLQAFVRAMLPGLFMLSGQDVAGTLPLSWYAMTDNKEAWDASLASRGAYAFTRSVPDRAVTAQGVPRTKTLYPPADEQILDEASFASRLAGILAVRTMHGIANGTLHGRFITRTPGSFAFAVLLPPADEAQPASLAPAKAAADERTPPVPGGDEALLKQADRKTGATDRRKSQHEENERLREKMGLNIIVAPRVEGVRRHGDAAILAVFNFSREPVSEILDLRHDPLLRKIREKGEPVLLAPDGKGDDEATMSHGEGTVTLRLPPWQGAVVRIGKR